MTARAIRLPVTQGTDEWLQMRMDGVTSADAPVLTGNRPGLLQLWAVKRRDIELDPPDAATQRMFDIGHRIEPLLADLYTEDQARPIERVNRMLRHPEIPWAFASLDRQSRRRSERRLVELKWAPHRRWNEGTESVPALVQDQVQWQLLVTGYDVADVAVLEGSKFTVHEIARDDDYIDDLLYLAKEFRSRVASGKPPLVDGSASTHRTLGQLYPRERADVIQLFQADPIWDDLAARYQHAEAAERIAKAGYSAVKAAVKALLTDSAGIASEAMGYQFTWKGTRSIDHRAVVTELINLTTDDVAGYRIGELIEEHTSTDWRAVVEAIAFRGKTKVIDRHASPTGPRRLNARFKVALAAPDEIEEEQAAA